MSTRPILPLELAKLLDAEQDFYSARARADDKAAIAAAERAMFLLRASVQPECVVHASATVTRSLWRLATRGELDSYLYGHLGRDLGTALLNRPDIRRTVARADRDINHQVTEIPKRMLTHEAMLRFLAIPLTEAKNEDPVV